VFSQSLARARVSAPVRRAGLAFAVTITVVIALFIVRPGGNITTAAAFGGYVGLAAINTIKGAAILMTIHARRVTGGPARA